MATNDIGVRVKLEGEQQYKEQMRQITQQTKLMRAETMAMESAWNKDSTAQQKAAQQTKLLKTQIDQQKRAVETARANVERYSQATGENSAQTLKWKTALAQAEAELNRLEKELAQVPNKAQLIGKAMQQVGQKIKAVGENITTVGRGLSRTLTVPLLAVGAGAAKLAMDFETSMAKVATIADESEVSLSDMGAAITNLSNETGVAATDIAESVYQAISAGQDTGKAVDFVTQSTKLAKAGFTDAATSVDLLTTILNAYGLQAEEVTNVSDMLIQTQNKGKTTIAQLGSSMGQVIPTAAAFNVELDQVTSAYVTMTKNGIDTAMATTALNGMLSELGKQGSKSAKILEEETGKSFAELMEEGYSLNDVLAIIGAVAEESGLEIGAMFSNQRAQKAARSLTQNADDFTDALESMGTAAGSTQAAFDKVTDTSAEQFKRILNELKNTGIDLGRSIMTTLAPSIQKGAGVIKDGTKWFAQLDDKTKENIVKFGLLAAAVGPVLSITGKLVSSVGSLVSTGGKVVEWVGKMAAGHAANAGAAAADAAATTAAAAATEGLNAAMAVSPIGAVALAIGALVGGILALKAGYEHAKEAALEENEALNETVTATKNATSGLQDAGNSLKDTYDEADRSIAQVMASSQRATTIADELAELQKKTKLTSDEQQRMKALVGELNGLYPNLGLAIDDNTGKLNKNADEIQNVVQQATNMAKVQAYQKAIASITEELGAAYEAQALAAWEADRAQEAAAEANKGRESDIARLQERIKSATGTEKELLQAQLDSLQAQGGQSLAVREANDALTQYNNTERETTRTIEEGNDKIDYLTEKMNEAAQEIGLTDEELANMGESTEDAADATADLAAETEDLGDTMEEAAEEISDASKEIIDAYTSTRDSAQQSVMDQKGLFEELEAAEAVSIESMVAGLQSHVDAYQNWNSNVESLMSSTRYQTDEGFRAMVNSVASAGIEMAPELQAIVTAFENGDVQIEQLVDGYGNMQQLSVEAAEKTAFAKTELQYGITGMAEAFAEGGITLEGAAGQMIEAASRPLPKLPGDGVFYASETVTGMSNTLNSGEPSAAMSASLARMEKENAKPAAAAGESIAGSVGEGMTDGSGEIAAGGDAMSGEVQSTLTEVGAQSSQAQSDGSEIAKAMAQGINGSKPLVIAAMNAVKTAISTSLLQIRGLSSTAKTNGQGISKSLRDGVNAGKAGVKTAMDGLKTTITDSLTSISSSNGTARTAGQNIGQNLADGISSKSGAVSTAASGLASSASSPLSSLQNSSRSWGEHLVSNFNAGLIAMTPRTEAAAKGVADAVKKYLGHSTPEDGPLKNDDVWGLHFGENFAAGIVRSVPIVEDAAYRMASAAVLDPLADVGMLSGQSEPLTADMMFDAFSAALREADMNVYIGNREFKRVLRENGAIA